MAQPNDHMRTPEDRESIHDPNNPPNSMLRLSTRRAALWSYLGSVIALFVVIGVALVYWVARGPVQESRDDRSNTEAVGTAGDTAPGGFDPAPRLDNTRDEIAYRGSVAPVSGESPSGTALTSVAAIDDLPATNINGQPVALSNVEVQSAQGTTMRVRDEEASAVVMMPTGQPFGAGDRVDVTGTLERDGHGNAQIRASKIVKRQ